MVSSLAWSWRSSDLLDLVSWHVRHACMRCTVHVTLLCMCMLILVVSVSTYCAIFFIATPLACTRDLVVWLTDFLVSFWGTSCQQHSTALAPRVCTLGFFTWCFQGFSHVAFASLASLLTATAFLAS